MIGHVIHFPQKTQYETNDEKPDLFRHLSDLVGFDLQKIVVQQDDEEIKRMQRKLQKDSLQIRSRFTK